MRRKGRIVHTISSKMGRFGGTLHTNGVNGSAMIAALATGRVAFQVTPISSLGLRLPTVTTAGTTVSWVYPPGTGTNAPCVIVVWVR
ncbi:hypothetical protein CA223_05515 [Sphingomonas koreensis]|uniref:Uncharacterized protein n=1 Tax=Sphingomonas koreensis TaxID=93064 RepID=A0A1L6JBQ9_9SPHN|nr:hypothetical protein BRX40_13870 [Sphingomonas koreensis]RSU30172.1 hypothetical protein CA225_05790 [Sphingomonas koreensis]RSU37391.1 hypothetical protein BRX39_05735 [Sphingomonas koreensis]RSU42304.1 hypothetical protein CA223_05515 [Sphingomonas koreensis]RSU52637.1 hypothetical protein CA221_03755 [Sphingomonas koreensis]